MDFQSKPGESTVSSKELSETSMGLKRKLPFLMEVCLRFLQYRCLLLHLVLLEGLQCFHQECHHFLSPYHLAALYHSLPLCSPECLLHPYLLFLSNLIHRQLLTSRRIAPLMKMKAGSARRIEIGPKEITAHQIEGTGDLPLGIVVEAAQKIVIQRGADKYVYPIIN